jgi:hypothetical protein
MATMTGENLLNSIIESSGVEVNSLIRLTLSAKLQQMIDNGTYSKLAASIAISGFSTTINDATDINELSDVVETNAALIAAAAEGEVDQIVFPPVGNGDDDPSDFTAVDIDTGTLQSPADFDADNGAYNFVDDAAVAGSVVISNFSSDDKITLNNAEISDYEIQNDGADVILSYNFNDEGIMNIINLAGVVSGDDLVYDQASLAAAIGFDVFGG